MMDKIHLYKNAMLFDKNQAIVNCIKNFNNSQLSDRISTIVSTTQNMLFSK